MQHAAHGANCANNELKFLTPVILLLLAGLSFLWPVRPTEAELVADLSTRLREERFERLYDEASDSVRLNVSREEFARRMKAAATKLKAIDPGLNFQKDPVRENLHSEPGSILLTSALKLEGDGKYVLVLFHWDREGRFADLSVTTGPETPAEFNVYGVAYESPRTGNQSVEE